VGLIHTMLTSIVVYSTMGSAHSTRNVSRGTPQGGVLSPLLWALVVNKLLSLLEEAGTKVVAYADDVVILLQGKFPQTLCNLMKTALSTLSRWTAGLFERRYKIYILGQPPTSIRKRCQHIHKLNSQTGGGVFSP